MLEDFLAVITVVQVHRHILIHSNLIYTFGFLLKGKNEHSPMFSFGEAFDPATF